MTAGGTPCDPGILPNFPTIPKSLHQTAIFHAVFPNVFYFLFPFGMFTIILKPINANETEERADFTIFKTAHPEFDNPTSEEAIKREQLIEDAWKFLDLTNLEDIDGCENVH